MRLGGSAGDNTCEGGNSGSDGDGIWGSGEDHEESGDHGGVDIERSMTTSASDHTGVAADSSVSNGSVSSADGA
ncbi:hypothetical protein Tco_1237444 [Tanacetum coccineum]